MQRKWTLSRTKLSCLAFSVRQRLKEFPLVLLPAAMANHSTDGVLAIIVSLNPISDPALPTLMEASTML